MPDQDELNLFDSLPPYDPTQEEPPPERDEPPPIKEPDDDRQLTLAL